jgi:UPF0271 protein
MIRIDLNSDLGESFGLFKVGHDEEMMKYVSSANVACGYHAGDPSVMRRTVELAKQNGVGVGDHPGFPDLMGFGRRNMSCSTQEIKDYVTYQIGALREFATASGVEVQHCKPHGSLFMMAMEDEVIARAILEAVVQVNPRMVVYALNNSAIAAVGEQMGVPIALEVYATATGSIVMARTGPNIEDYASQAEKVVRLIRDGKVIADTGEEVTLQRHTLCIHGDTPGADKLAKAIDKAFKENGIEITSIKNVLGL